MDRAIQIKLLGVFKTPSVETMLLVARSYRTGVGFLFEYHETVRDLMLAGF